METALRKLGFSKSDIERTADVIIEADLRGVDSHGVRAFASRLADLTAGRIKVNERPALITEYGSIALYDGRHGYGPLLCSDVASRTTELAERYGIGMVLLRRSSHWGCPAYYSRAMAAKNFIGIAISNTNLAMPLWGSSEKSVGNNPITIAAPRAAAEPVVLDIAMQKIAWGRVQLAREEGRVLPGNWGYDASGSETSDPAAIIASGRVRPMGDYKGSGLAFMLEILTGVLSGGSISAEISQHTTAGAPANYCQTFIAIRTDAVGGRAEYEKAIEHLYATSKAASKVDGISEVLLPGDQSNAVLRERRANGIPVTRLREAVVRISDALQIPCPDECA